MLFFYYDDKVIKYIIFAESETVTNQSKRVGTFFLINTVYRKC
jgi:hypothetical protein